MTDPNREWTGSTPQYKAKVRVQAFEVTHELYEALRAVAQQQGKPMTAVLRAALEAYIRDAS